jgi:hypothetical protein
MPPGIGAKTAMAGLAADGGGVTPTSAAAGSLRILAQ